MNECLKLHKLSSACRRGPFILRPLASVFRHLSQFLFACHIGTDAQIGEGCVFQHNGVGVVISERAIIGDNVEVFQGVTIGERRGVPVIEDNVSIGANAVLLGPITIGDGARIGAGAVVLEDVSAYSTAVGVPARMIMKSEQ